MYHWSVEDTLSYLWSTPYIYPAHVRSGLICLSEYMVATILVGTLFIIFVLLSSSSPPSFSLLLPLILPFLFPLLPLFALPLPLPYLLRPHASPSYIHPTQQQQSSGNFLFQSCHKWISLPTRQRLHLCPQTHYLHKI